MSLIMIDFFYASNMQRMANIENLLLTLEQQSNMQS